VRLFFAGGWGHATQEDAALHALHVDLFLRQQGLDTQSPSGKAMFQMMGVFAEFERAMIAERVRAGLRRAKDEGKRLDLVRSARCPLYPRKRTLPDDAWMSALCQKQTKCIAAKNCLFDHLVGAH
jgi:Resolvase, N terminal domain